MQQQTKPLKLRCFFRNLSYFGGLEVGKYICLWEHAKKKDKKRSLLKEVDNWSKNQYVSNIVS